jgi:hypothetical protein
MSYSAASSNGLGGERAGGNDVNRATITSTAAVSTLSRAWVRQASALEHLNADSILGQKKEIGYEHEVVSFSGR